MHSTTQRMSDGPTGDVTVRAAVGSLGTAEGRAAFLELPTKLPALRYIGFAVTDSGIVKDSQTIVDLAEFLFRCFHAIPSNVLSIINTDNVPNNGDAIKRFVLEAAWADKPPAGDATLAAFVQYLDDKVHFHNTMVDRLTNHRAGDHLVPLTEPRPRKALVIEDLCGVLDAAAFRAQPGVHIRLTQAELAEDRMLKLCVANAVSTAMIHLMAVNRVNHTVRCFQHPLVRPYLDALYETDIVPAVAARGVARATAQQTYDEWMARFEHGAVGLDTFWVGQNALFKYNVRLFASIRASAAADAAYRPSVLMAFATAAVLRYLTPIGAGATETGKTTPLGEPVFLGRMDPTPAIASMVQSDKMVWVYGDGMTADVVTGAYEFSDDAGGRIARLLARASADVLQADAEPLSRGTSAIGVAVVAALSTLSGFDVTEDVFASFAIDVAALYERMLRATATGGSSLDVLADVMRSRR